MSNWWRIKWRDFNEPEMLISEAQGRYINEQLGLEPTREDRFIINNIPYRYAAIETVEPTAKRVENSVKELFAGVPDALLVGPVLDTEGFVVANWYKREVNGKEFERYYASHPSYKSLGRNDNGNYLVAFRRAEELNSHVSSDIELCDEQEVERLWRSYGND